jgi:hypothetical protein
MPSPIPSLIYGAVTKPEGGGSQTGCVQCLSEGVHAPQEIIYNVGGYSMCMKHTQAHLQRTQTNVS